MKSRFVAYTGGGMVKAPREMRAQTEVNRDSGESLLLGYIKVLHGFFFFFTRQQLM
jgi:hypothetical protein